MTSAPDHEPGPPPTPTDWTRLALGIVGLVIGLAIIYLGLKGL